MSDWSRVPYRRRRHIKALLLARDGLTCCNCGQPIASARAATIEHKVPRRFRTHALTDLDNLGLSHASCNYSHAYEAAGSRDLVVDGSSFFSSPTP